MNTHKFIVLTQNQSKLVDNLHGIDTDNVTIIRVDFNEAGNAFHSAVVPCGVGHHEPTFTLRAQDAMACDYVAHWAAMAELMGVPQEKVISAKSISRAMRDWHDRKVPD